MPNSTSRKIVFLTSAALADGTADDLLLKKTLEASGHQVTYAVWSDKNVNWSSYDLALVRSTWDYYTQLPVFLETLAHIAKATRLINSEAILRWNARKDYLLELQNKNISVVPTFTADDAEMGLRAAVLLLRKEKTIVVKPSVSAGSYLTYKVSTEAEIEPAVRAVLAHGDVILQPYLRSVAEDGEISLIYFRGASGTYELSHATLKKSKPGDYRVQTQFGGTVEATTAQAAWRSLAEKALQLLPEPVTFARVDIVDQKYYAKIGEIELIEPDLYFRTNPEATHHFAKALETMA